MEEVVVVAVARRLGDQVVQLRMVGRAAVIRRETRVASPLRASERLDEGAPACVVLDVYCEPAVAAVGRGAGRLRGVDTAGELAVHIAVAAGVVGHAVQG